MLYKHFCLFALQNFWNAEHFLLCKERLIQFYLCKALPTTRPTTVYVNCHRYFPSDILLSFLFSYLDNLIHLEFFSAMITDHLFTPTIGYYIVPTPLLDNPTLPHWMEMPTWSYVTFCMYLQIFAGSLFCSIGPLMYFYANAIFPWLISTSCNKL